MKYYVYSTKYDRGDRRMARWVEFESQVVAMLFAKVNGYKLIAKGK